jgi:hypothetical protein
LLDEIHLKWENDYKYEGDPSLFTFYDKTGERVLRFCKSKLETILADLQSSKFSYYKPALNQMIGDQWVGSAAYGVVRNIGTIYAIRGQWLDAAMSVIGSVPLLKEAYMSVKATRAAKLKSIHSKVENAMVKSLP